MYGVQNDVIASDECGGKHRGRVRVSGLLQVADQLRQRVLRWLSLLLGRIARDVVQVPNGRLCLQTTAAHISRTEFLLRPGSPVQRGAAPCSLC